jgi:putative acetyltransferase
MITAQVRTILVSDNSALANIVRNTLSEFGANKPGTVFDDKTTDHLYELFQTPGSIYYVAEMDQKIIGGAGIFPSKDLPKGTCELVKMYLIPEARGHGLGKLLIDRCLHFAENNGYKKVYIETMPELKKAVGIYEKYGFKKLGGPLGNTGHFGCDVWMILDLESSSRK